MTLMATEIAEQPAVLERVLAGVPPQLETLPAPRFVLLAARGTSDNAALYAKYLVETAVGLPAGLASPSAMTLYGARLDLRDVLVIAVSQSGATPEIVPPVPMPATKWVILPAVCSQISGPVVS